MNNNKQSSVEQLAIALYDNGLLQGNGNHIDDLLLHFKAMHKEEIKAAYNQGYRDGEHDNGNTTHVLGDVSVWDDSENYYNETYGVNNE